MLIWDICGGYVPWLKYLKISWVRYLQYPHCWTNPLAVRGCYRCLSSLDNLHLLQDVLICFVSISQVEPGAIWMCFPNHLNCLQGYDIYIYMGAGINIKHGSRSRAHTRSILHDPYPDPYPMILHDPYPWSIPLIRTPFSLKKDWCWP